MAHRSLRVMAAYDALGMATTDWLIDAAHKALDDGVYSPNLGHLATFRDPTWGDCHPLFVSALEELEVPVPKPAAAVLALLDLHVIETAEGVTSPARMLNDLYAIERAVRYQWPVKVPPDALEPLAPFINLYYGIDEIVGYQSYQREQGIPVADESGLETHYGEAEALALDWCRRKWGPLLDVWWRTTAVVGLALGIAADKAFDRLPVLADALEDAGCSDGLWLGHLREGSPHASRCVLVDLLLGESRVPDQEHEAPAAD